MAAVRARFRCLLETSSSPSITTHIKIQSIPQSSISDPITMNASYFSSSTTFYYHTDDDAAPRRTIPIDGPDPTAAAAVKIQAAVRSQLVRSLVRRIRAVDEAADRFERLIRRQETVDAVRGDARERIRVGEGMMAILLELDSVPGFYPAVRDLRRRVSRRIVGLQEVLDAVVAAPAVGAPDGIPGSWAELVAGAGERAEEERAGRRERRRGFECCEEYLFGGGVS